MTIYTASLLQSNGVGADGHGHMFVPSSVKVWNNIGIEAYPVTDTTSGIGNCFVTPVKNAAPFRTTVVSGGLVTLGCNNPGIHFAGYLARSTGQQVRNFMLCRGATTLESWILADGTRKPLYTKMANILSAAETAQGENIVLRVVSIHGGEGDNDPSFKGLLLALRTAMITDGWADEDTLFILTEPKASYSAGVAALHATAAEESQFVVAHTNHFEIDPTDHYYGDALQYIGYACMRALLAHAPTAALLDLPYTPAHATDWVSLRGFADQTGGNAYAQDTWKNCPLIGDLGYVEMVNRGGWIVIPEPGPWEFRVRASIVNARGLSLRLATSGGSHLAYLTANKIPDSNSEQQWWTGSAEILLPKGTTVALSLKHNLSSDRGVSGASAYDDMSLFARRLNF